MMSAEERKALRAFYVREYKIKTGIELKCMEAAVATLGSKTKGIFRTNIVDVAAEYHQVPAEKIVSNSREVAMVDIRNMITAMAKDIYKNNLSYDEIAAIVNRDRTTALNSMNTHTNQMKTDKDYKSSYRSFKEYAIGRIKDIYDNRFKHIQELSEQGVSAKKIAEIYGVTNTWIRKIKNRKDEQISQERATVS